MLTVLGTLLTMISAGTGLASLCVIVPEQTRSLAVRKARDTAVVRVQNRELDEVEILLQVLASERGEIAVNVSERSVRITDVPGNLERLRRIVHEVDEPGATDQRIWIYCMTTLDANEAAQVLNRVAGESGVSKVIPVSREQMLIIVANRAGYDRMMRIAREIDRPMRLCGRMPKRPNRPQPPPESEPIQLPIGPP